MPLQLLQYTPGVVKDITDYTAGKNGPYWTDSNHVRFKNGYPEKIGGWVKDIINGLNPDGSPSEVETNIQGIARRMVFWRSFTDAEDRIVVGTHTHLYIVRDNYLYDITPLRSTSPNLSNPFQITVRSITVVVTEVLHGAADGDFVVFSDAEAVGEFSADVLNRRSGFQITLISPNSYSIDLPLPATSTTSGGGDLVKAAHLIGRSAGLGIQSATPAVGYGVGRWSASTWGTPRAETSADTNLDNSSWNLDLWGEDVIATVRSGAIYHWAPTFTDVGRAVLVSSEPETVLVPPTARVTSVSFPDRHFVVGGCVPYGIPNAPVDNMLIRWSTQENFRSFDPFLPGSTSGDQRLEIGTKIVAITPAREETIISTDEAIYGMNFVGGDFIFSFRLLSADAAASGLNSTISIDGDIYWMGETNFFKYDGIVRKLVCPVQYHVFSRLEKRYIEKVVVGGNKKYKEVTWFYTSIPNEDDPLNTENNEYVTYNYEEDVWTIGTLKRSVWSDSFGFKDVPFAFSPDGYLYDHETGTSEDGEPMLAYIDGASRELTSEGDSLYMIDKIIPDATMTPNTNLSIYMSTKKYPNAKVIRKGPFNVTSTTEHVSTRSRGRQIAMRFESTGHDDQWSLGSFRVNVLESGLR